MIAFFSKGKLETYFFFGGTGFLTSFLTSLPLTGFIGAFAIVILLIDKLSAFSSKINSIPNIIRLKKFRKVFFQIKATIYNTFGGDINYMKITKELLKKLVREAVEEEMGSEGQTDTKSSSGSDLVKKLKDKVLTIGSPSGWGEWITDKDDEWFYDDGEGGYDTELEFDYKDPANIVVRSGEDEETIPLNNDDDIEEIIKYAERISGLKAEPEEEDESPGEPSAGPLSESVKRRFARLANIKHKK